MRNRTIPIGWALAGALCVTASCGSDSDTSFARHRPEFMAIAQRLVESANPWFGTKQVHELREQLRDKKLSFGELHGFWSKRDDPIKERAEAFFKQYDKDQDGFVTEREAGAKTWSEIAAADTNRAEGVPFQTGAQMRLTLCHHLLRIGDVDGAIAAVETTFSLGKEQGQQVYPVNHVVLGLAYLRKAEVENCIGRHHSECCIFPLTGGGAHTIAGSARRAQEQYLKFLAFNPKDLVARWHLNLAAMALTEYPAGVPVEFRIPCTTFDSSHDIGRFTNIAPALNIHTFNGAGGVVAEDFDNDGDMDIVTTTMDPDGPASYYRNTGTGRFENLSAASRIDDQLGGLNCTQADYDGDGDMDVLVLRGGWLLDDGHIRNSLLRNAGDGTFEDVTHEAGMATPAYPTQTAVWADFDNDGDLDVYIGNESRPKNGVSCPGQLFMNDGDGHFTDRAKEAGVTNDRFCKAVTAGDIDNDGDMDLYVSNNGRNRLYLNNGDSTFTDIASQAGVGEPNTRSFASWFFDYDNDGWLDLFVAAFAARLEDVALDYLGQPHIGTSPCLYRNLGNGRFENVAKRVGLAHPYLPMGANFGDLDNDGYLDIYLTTGDPDYYTLTPNVMLRNDGGKRFQNVTTSGGFGHLQKGHGVAFADFDHDGDQDIYNQLGGFFAGDKYHNAFYENPGHGNRFLHVRLVGTTSTRSAVGARIKVVAKTADGTVTLHRAVGSVSSFGGSPLRQEIGLGKATAIESLEVRWPKSKTKQVFSNVPIDASIRITEGRDEIKRLELRTFRFQR